MTRYINTITLVNTTYRNKTILNSVNLADVPWEDNSMDQAFTGCTNLKSVININENVTDMNSAFHSCHNLNQTPTIHSGVTNLYETFYECYNLSSIPMIPDSVTNMVGTFEYCNNISIFPHIPYDVTNLHNTFHGCSKLDDTSAISNNVTDLSGTFSGCSKLEYTTDLSDANSVTNMEETFMGCSNIRTAPVIPNGVTTMKSTFNGCSLLENTPDLSDLTSLLTMGSTFADCSLIEEPSIIPNTVRDIEKVYYNCSSLKNMPSIPNSVVNMNSSFYGCNLISEVPDMINVKSINDMYSTFYNCTNVEGDIFIGSENISNAIDCFGATSKEKDVYIPFKNSNNGYTNTLKSFNTIAYYPYDNIYNTLDSQPLRKDGVLLKDSNGWRYKIDENGYRILEEYLGKDTIIYPMIGKVKFNDIYYEETEENIYPPYETTRESNTPFYHNVNVYEAHLDDVEWVNNSMAYSFVNDTTLTAVYGIQENVSNFHRAFEGCINLNYIELPPSFWESDTEGCFFRCENISSVSIPEPSVGQIVNVSMAGLFMDSGISGGGIPLPEGVLYIPYIYSNTNVNTVNYPTTVINTSHAYENTNVRITLSTLKGDVSWTFKNCQLLERIADPVDASLAVNMQGTFYNCPLLESCPDLIAMGGIEGDLISNGLIDISNCFNNCQSLTSVGRIVSPIIANMADTFSNCKELVSIPSIPYTVTNLANCFYGCESLEGNVYIFSEKATDVYQIFDETNQQDKNVYVPFTSLTSYEYTNAYYWRCVDSEKTFYSESDFYSARKPKSSIENPDPVYYNRLYYKVSEDEEDTTLEKWVEADYSFRYDFDEQKYLINYYDHDLGEWVNNVECIYDSEYDQIFEVNPGDNTPIYQKLIDSEGYSGEERGKNGVLLIDTSTDINMDGWIWEYIGDTTDVRLLSYIMPENKEDRTTVSVPYVEESE